MERDDELWEALQADLGRSESPDVSPNASPAPVEIWGTQGGGVTPGNSYVQGSQVLQRHGDVTTLGRVFSEYDVVETHVAVEDGDRSYILVTDRGYGHDIWGGKKFAQGRNVSLPSNPWTELGTTSVSPWTSYLREEYNSELRGQNGLRNYDKMRKSDATVRNSLRVNKTPVLAARWFVEPASESARDRAVAEFVWKCFTEYMSIPWSQVLIESLLMLDFGYYMFEKVFDFRIIDGRERVVWKKLAPRHPMDVKDWQFDREGGPRRVLMVPGPDDYGIDEIPIEIEKLLVFTFDKEAGDITGTSILRSAYKHWFYKDQLYKIDAIQKERHGIGIPIIKLPPNFNDSDKRLAEDLGRNLRTNERAHVVLPPNWDIQFAKLEGQPVDCIPSIEHHMGQIDLNVLNPVGAKGTGDAEQHVDMFLKAAKYVADIVQDAFNHYAIPQLVNFNYMRVPGYPKLRVRRIGEQADWRTLSFAVRNFVGAGVIRPDDPLEAAIRDEMDLPIADPETTRVVATPQGGPGATGGGGVQPGGPKPPGPPRVGPPRQSTQPNVAPPSANAGRDRSGG